MKSLLEILGIACANRGKPCALATLVGSSGSTYRKPGARMLVLPEGTVRGVLSGGCLEEEVGRLALGVISSGRSRLVTFDTRRLYGCDGSVDIFIERIPADEGQGNFLTRMDEKFRAREICRTRTWFGEGEGHSEILPDAALVVERDDTFVQTIPLPVRLLLFGQGPEVAPLRWFATGLGWQIHPYAQPGHFPEDIRGDGQTVALIMNHHFGRDLASLERVLPLALPYVGLLGPRRRQAELLGHLCDLPNFITDSLAAIHAPAGLDIGSESPEEIALSILSEVSAVLSQRNGGFLRERTSPIHQSTLRGKEA
ncbi:XdhC family protein [Luteolibacter yonseiensis]|uniref:XdhC family protein n=1 Tax=Luteolibacter yonseiensis TaxID=1144680 RepID=A0A934R253_9BACT|nr:XdhC family protein [Luteolibacter yonseiensis]MBK1817008.1 XdhC family protein [Luteolibacter yonseiensis]